MRELWSDYYEGVICISQKLHHYWNLTIRSLSVISTILIAGGLTPLQRYSRWILLPQQTWLLIWGVLPLCRVAIGAFYNPSWLGHSFGGVLPLCRDAVAAFYSPSWLGHSSGKVLPLCRDAIGAFYRPSWLGHSPGGVLPLCKDAVGAFYNPGRLGNRTLDTFKPNYII